MTKNVFNVEVNLIYFIVTQISSSEKVT